MNCSDCTMKAACCGNTHADGTCKGCKSFEVVPCARHAGDPLQLGVEKTLHLVRQREEQVA